MAFKTVAELTNALNKKTPGATVSESKAVEIFGEAASVMLSKISPKTAIRTVELHNPFSSALNQYAIPQDVKSIISVKKNDKYYFQYGLNDMRHDKLTGQIAMSAYKGFKIIEIDDSDNAAYPRVTVDDTSSISKIDVNSLENILDVRLELLNKVNQSAYMLVLNKDTQSASYQVQNLNVPPEGIEDDGSLYMLVFMPSTIITELELTLNTNIGNMVMTATSQQLASKFVSGWNLVRMQLDPNQIKISESIITGYKLKFKYNPQGLTLPDNIYPVLVDTLYLTNNESIIMEYNSYAIFFDVDEGFVDVPTSTSNTVMLEPITTTILLYEAGKIRTQQVQAEDGAFNYSYFEKELGSIERATGLYGRYASLNPEEAQPVTSFYYRKLR